MLLRIMIVTLAFQVGIVSADDQKKPLNVFIAISDDQSWPHASAYGSKMVSTPHFDRVAKEGVLFTNAFCASPGCSPSRAALLTGRNTWELEHAGTHASYFHPKYVTFPDRLAKSGYFVGSCGKGWGPGDFKKLGRTHNPAGPRFNAPKKKGEPNNYSASFAKFLKERPKDKPFCFWFGSSDPHRAYKKGSGLAKGKKLSQAEVPSFLPDTKEIRSDLLDYTFEVERFDDDLGKMLALMEKEGLLDNTIVIVTSDNGFPVPRAKANCYEHGIHVPLAIRMGKRIKPGRVLDDLVGFTDLTATICEATGLPKEELKSLRGTSLMGKLESDPAALADLKPQAVFAARERHSSSRYNSLSYPQRCIRTREYLYIRNFKPERWPAGPGQKYANVKFDKDGKVIKSKLGPPHGGYHDIDACPTLTYLIQNQDDPKIRRYLDLAVAKRPAEELFDIQKDPGCLNNLANDLDYVEVKRNLSKRLMDYLKKTGDARVTGNGDVWETYPRVSGLRWFPEPEWAKENPKLVPKQEWLDKRRPR